MTSCHSFAYGWGFVLAWWLRQEQCQRCRFCGACGEHFLSSSQHVPNDSDAKRFNLSLVVRCLEFSLGWSCGAHRREISSKPSSSERCMECALNQSIGRRGKRVNRSQSRTTSQKRCLPGKT